MTRASIERVLRLTAACLFAVALCGCGGKATAAEPVLDGGADAFASDVGANDVTAGLDASGPAAEAASDAPFCSTPFWDCGGKCVNLESDSDNCGACGAVCAPGQPCSAGKCACLCAVHETDCPSAAEPCDCTDTMTDPRHCGTCGTACLPGQLCFNGACMPLDAGND
jgi:hypothetical protein